MQSTSENDSDGCPGRPIRVSHTRLHFKVSPLARPPGICETASRPRPRKLDAKALDFAPLLAEPHRRHHTLSIRERREASHLVSPLTTPAMNSPDNRIRSSRLLN